MSKSVSPRAIGDIVKQIDSLEGLRQQAAILQRLERFIRQIPDLPAAEHISVGAIHGDRLVLLAESPAWASKIRYAVPILLEKFRDHNDFNGLRSIRIRIKSDRGVPSVERGSAKATISESALAELERSADSIGDREIAAAMRRIRKHHGS